MARAHDHARLTTTVLDVSGVQWASEQAVIDKVVRQCAGVVAVDVNRHFGIERGVRL